MASNGEAVIEDGSLVIRVPLNNLEQVIEGSWALGALEVRYKITDVNAFAKDLVGQLNTEDEQGTTLVHTMFDKAISEAIESGADGIDEHEDQEG